MNLKNGAGGFKQTVNIRGQKNARRFAVFEPTGRSPINAGNREENVIEGL